MKRDGILDIMRLLSRRQYLILSSQYIAPILVICYYFFNESLIDEYLSHIPANTLFINTDLTSSSPFINKYFGKL